MTRTRTGKSAKPPSRARPASAARDRATAPAEPTAGPPAGSWPRIRFAPSVLGVGLAAFGLLHVGPEVPAVTWSMVVVGLLLVGWNLWLLSAPAARARGLTVDVSLRPQHYMQVLVQSTIYLYWGWHLPIPLVREHIPMLLAQIGFAYGFDLLLAWSRRGTYTLGFGPCPVILSINLFLWFKADWFYLQFVVVSAGFLAKEMIRWTRDGKKAHIFNPSSFPLALASLVLIATASTDLTYGPLIAQTQSMAPNMYLLLFLIALPSQIMFGVSATALAAAVTTYVLGQLFLAALGTYFFIDCSIPVSVFIGMLLLVTDPATSPRTELGRLIFGALYGLTTMILYQLLNSAGVPSFYDKLLQVPLLNLSVRALDRLSTTTRLAAIDPQRLARALHPRWRHVAYTSIWCTAFALMTAAGGVGDHHPGQFWPYWIEACNRGNQRACAYLGAVDQQMCDAGSGWACNEAGILGSRSAWGMQSNLDGDRRVKVFQRGCDLRVRVACSNRVRLDGGQATFEHADPTPDDYRVLLRGSKRFSVPDTTDQELYARACQQGWPRTCELAGGRWSPP